MKHLLRAGALLGVLIFAFALVRLLPVPAVLEPYGFYEERGNESEWASWPMQYADPALCNDCHQDKHGAWQKSKHSTVSCENCHGPGAAHVAEMASLPIDTSREACGVCHARVLARPGDFPQINLDEHGGQAGCITCHNPHNPAAATAPVIPHILQGRDDCLSCHHRDGIKPFPESHEGRSRDSCLNCHRRVK